MLCCVGLSLVRLYCIGLGWVGLGYVVLLCRTGLCCVVLSLNGLG